MPYCHVIRWSLYVCMCVRVCFLCVCACAYVYFVCVCVCDLRKLSRGVAGVFFFILVFFDPFPWIFSITIDISITTHTVKYCCYVCKRTLSVTYSMGSVTNIAPILLKSCSVTEPFYEFILDGQIFKILCSVSAIQTSVAVSNYCTSHFLVSL